MRLNLSRAFASIFGVLVVCVGLAAAQPSFKAVADGGKFNAKGIIVSRGADSLIVKDTVSSDQYFVELPPGVEVKTYIKGVFRGGKQYGETQLLRGLHVELYGTGNS